MTTSPYTHPSMPGTAPMVFDLPAALEDAEGVALIKAIHQRKARGMKVMTHEGWKDLSVTSVELPIPEADLFREPGHLVPKKMAASVQVTWTGISEDFMALMLGYESAAAMREADRKWAELADTARHWAVKWGRGHGKRAALEKIRGRAVVTDWLAGVRGEEYPWAESITWACPRPTNTMPPLRTIRLHGYDVLVPINTPESSVKVTSVNP